MASLGGLERRIESTNKEAAEGAPLTAVETTKRGSEDQPAEKVCS